jgi:hypothetical protein
MNLKEAKAIVGSLGHAGKMPATTYGIPAKYCKTGRKLAKIDGSNCSVCYAFERGHYRFESTKKSQETRFSGLAHKFWVEAMVLSLEHAYGWDGETCSGKEASPHHRWFDSGDLQSRDMLARICQICRATPWLEHWLPTKEAGILVGFVKDGGTIPGNLKIRLSGTMIDGPAPKAWGLTSTVFDKAEPQGHECPARHQGNQCNGAAAGGIDCRACWDASVPSIAYHLH